MNIPADMPATALQELLFEQEHDFLGVFDLAQDRYVRINRAGLALLGYSSEQALLNMASPSFRLLPLSGPERGRLIELVRHTGRHETEAEMARFDGSTFWARQTVTLFHDQRLALVRIMNLERLHQAERELAHSLRRYEAIFSNATIGIIVCNRQGGIVSANAMAAQLFGYPDGGLASGTIEQLVPEGVGRYHEQLRHSFHENPQVRAMGHNRDLHARRRDGSVFPVEISLSYFYLEEELYVVAYIIDITFKKETEGQLLAHRTHIEKLNADLEQKVADRTHALLNTLEQLERSKEELARALAAERELGELKSRFVAMASHEFRTPLTAVLTSAALIEKYAGGEQQDKRQKHLGRIRVSVNHLNDILEEFLSVGRLEEGRVQARPVQTDVPRLLADTVADMQGLLKPGQAVQVEPDCPAPVWLDGSLLRKIVVNLISNAVKYSGPGSVVALRGTCAGGVLTLSVQDQGVGISEEDQQHLFERFFRAKNAAHVAGTGLGLHIVARYAELMGGQVALHSKLNQGTTVILTLPYEDHPAD